MKIFSQKEYIMLEPEEIRVRLYDAKLTSISRNAGINYNMICRFMKGYDARVSLIKKLSEYLENKENGLGND